MNAPVRPRPGSRAQQASLSYFQSPRWTAVQMASRGGEEVAEKKGPGEGETKRSADGRKRENRGSGTCESEPGDPGKPSLGTCASPWPPANPNCSHQNTQRKRIKEEFPRIGNEPQGNTVEFSQPIK